MAPSRVQGVRRLNGLFEQAREPVFALDAERRLVYANAALRSLVGRTAEELSGLECRPAGPAPASDLESLGGALAPPPESASGAPCGGATLVVRSSGERVWRRAEFWPLRDDDGRTVGLFGMLRGPDAPPHAPESENRRLRAEVQELRERMAPRFGFDFLAGRGPGQRRVMDQIDAAAATRVPVLVVGEPGTGRRTVARAIHQLSGRPPSSLIAFDCAALPTEALERELFQADTPGPARFRPPVGSTVLLVDVLDLPRDLQGRLASVPDQSVRVIGTCATEPEVARRRESLRDDLYFALTALVVRLDPLRDRLDDLPMLAQHLLDRANGRAERRLAGLRPEAIEALRAYDWPGNIRELARVVEAAHAAASGDLIETRDLPAAVRGHYASAYTPPPMPPAAMPLDGLLNGLERRLIEQALARARQNKSRAAELLEISRPRLYRRIKELNIPDIPENVDEGPPKVDDPQSGSAPGRPDRGGPNGTVNDTVA